MTSVEAKNFLASIDSIPMACNDAPQEFIDKLNMAMEALREDKSIWLSTDDLPHEIWREIEGYNGDYLASIFGRIKSFKFGECRIMKQCNGVRGYQLIELSKGNVQKSFRAHRIKKATQKAAQTLITRNLQMSKPPKSFLLTCGARMGLARLR